MRPLMCFVTQRRERCMTRSVQVLPSPGHAVLGGWCWCWPRAAVPMCRRRGSVRAARGCLGCRTSIVGSGMRGPGTEASFSGAASRCRSMERRL